MKNRFGFEGAVKEAREVEPGVTELTFMPCVACGIPADPARVPTDRYLAWQAGAKIQQIFPAVPADEREVMISGTHPACFDAMWGETG